MTSNLTSPRRGVLRMIATGPTVPNDQWKRCRGPQIGPHNRSVDSSRHAPAACTHPTEPPAGYRRCAGDTACPMYLRHRRLCSAHEDLVYALPPAERYEELMGAKPRPIVVPYR